jgi:hypothetical protein
MATYFVRDNQGYVTVVEADTYRTDDAGVGVFEFFNAKGLLAASFPINTTLSVVEADDAFQGIFPDDDMEIEESRPEETDGLDAEEDDVCLDCRFDEFLDSEAFFNAVMDVIDAYCSPEEEEEEKPEVPEVSETKPELLPQLKVLKATHEKDGHINYGFITPIGFVDYHEKQTAVEGLKLYNNGEKSWHYANPADYTFTEVDNG